ncbi:hypothetical protein GSI_13589 [Ganoderma sinense ZZ0214-1]|uniref:AMP-dependent synthetase/ligase domain-containing protein n=1 Tax=Ganoderma sinense ZZ0214-1 TaxID=1077348 RepID=A0A2G8RR76_9APHY|nr:hypothetical protein GSI_13589 [Ganoderma sinense ZZ0214-1]
MAVSDYLVTDDLTIILALVAAGLFLLHNLYKPQALVHPILLGRQSDVARVRNPSESAVYRNYGTGMLGRFPLRPTKDQQVVLDLVKPDVDAPRTLWSTKITNLQLRERVANVGAGLTRAVGLVPQESNVLLLLNDGIEFLVADLALSALLVPTFTVASASVISPVLESHPPSVIITNPELLQHVLELIYDAHESEHHTIVVTGDISGLNLPKVDHVKILMWDDIEADGAAAAKAALPVPDPNDVYTVSFFQTPTGDLEGVQLTHQNLTAGIAATRALLPPSSALSPLDTIVSAFPLGTPYGRAVAYTALFEGTGFATVDSTKLIKSESGGSAPTGMKDLRTSGVYSVSSPTLLFVRPDHLNSLTDAISQEASNSSWFLFNFAWRHKLAGVLEGYITKQSLWDRLVFDSARMKVMGKGAGTVRAVVVGGGPLEAQNLTPSRIALSVPVINVHSHPLVAGPVFASHALDLQTFPPSGTAPSASASDAYAFTYLAPVGPPSVNVEVKLTGVDDSAVEAGSDPVGALRVRGPSVGRPLSVEEEAQEEEERGWRTTGEHAKVAANGTFKVSPAGKA